MARCSCASSGCNCAIVDSTSVEWTGDGSPANPYEADVYTPTEFANDNGMFYVLDYVAAGTDPDDVRTGLVDATNAIQSAITDAMAARGTVVFPCASRLRYNAQLATVTAPMQFLGCGWLQTMLIPDPAYNGPAFVVDDCYRAGEGQVDDLTINLNVFTAGVSFKGLSIVSEDWADEHHGIWFTGRNDLQFMEDMWFMLLRGTALSIAEPAGNQFMRECYFHHMRFEQCGDNSVGFDAVTIDTGVLAGDGTNHLTFSQLELVYNNGPMVIQNTDGATDVQRRLTFNNLMLHGKGTGATAQVHPLLLIEGRQTDVVIDRMKTNSAPAGAYSLVVQADGLGQYPRQLTINDLSLSNAPGGGVQITRVGACKINGMSQGGAAVLGEEIVIGPNAANGDIEVNLLAAPGMTQRNILVYAEDWRKVSGTVGPVGNFKKWEDIDPRGSTILYSMVASSGTAVATIGAANTTTGTIAGASDTDMGWVSNIVSAAGAGAIASVQTQGQPFMAGSLLQECGAGVRFRAFVRYPDASYNEAGAGTGTRIFCGLTNQTNAVAFASDDPAGHRAGFQRIHVNAGKQQLNWFITTKDNITENLVDTGVSFSVDNIYELEMCVLEGSQGIWWRIIDWTGLAITEGTVTTRLPGEGAALRMHCGVSTVDAVARSFDFTEVSARSLS